MEAGLKTRYGLTKREREMLKKIGLASDEIFYLDWLKRKKRQTLKWRV